MATLLGAGFGNSLAFGTVLGLLVPYAVEHVGLSSDDGRIGVLYGSLGVGGLIAGLAFSRIFSVPRIRLLTPASLLCAGLLIAALCASRSWFVGAVVIGMFSMSITTTIMIGITYRQIAAPDEIRSSVNVIGRRIAWGGQPFGAAIGAVVAATFSVRAAYAVAATVMLVTSFGAYAALRGRPSLHRPDTGASTIESA